VPTPVTGTARAILDVVASLRRRSALHGWRLGLCVVLVGSAVAFRGSIGVLLAVMALMLVLDSVIPVPRPPWAAADDRFGRAVRERRHAHRMRRLRGRSPEQLAIFDDGDGWASIATRRELGVRSIPIDSITGTVERSKAQVFDRSFRPDRSASERWKSLWMAHARGQPLPPISVYRIADEHILRDGHHRVSVMRDHGSHTIEAEVVELVRPRAPTAIR
jgi:hypothetical protein